MNKRSKLTVFLCLFLCIMMAAGCMPVQSVKADEPTDVWYGDVNDDGKIDAKDVTMLRRQLAGGWNVNINEEKADLNQDSEINAKDVTMLRRYLAGGWGVVLPDKTPVSAKNYYYTQLNELEKEIYERAKKATWDNNEIVIANSENYTYDEIRNMFYRTLTALSSDDPRFKYFWTYWNCVEEDGQIKGVLDKNPAVSEYLIEKADTIAQNIVDAIPKGTDRYSTIRMITTYIKVNTEYDPYYPFISNVVGMYNDTGLGVFIKKRAVCAGYADATKILFDKLDIPCIIVGNAGHAWNYVQMEDGKWYALDMSVATYLDGFDEDLRDAFILNNTFLCGAMDYQYLDESSYHLSELYLGSPDDFEFPNISENNYIYKGTYVDNMRAVEDFIEKEGEFIYQINEDGETCKIVAYEGEEKGDLIIPSSIDGYIVTTIGDGAFYRMEGFTGDILIPDTVTIIECGAFKNCYNLSGQIKFSDSLEIIENNAFVGCSNLSGTLELPASLKVIGRSAFYDCKGFTGDLLIPDNIKSLDNCFEECSGFDGVVIIGAGLTDWDSTTTVGTSFTGFLVDDSNEYLASVDGALYSKDLKTLITCPINKEGDLIIPDTVTEIKTYACFGCKKIDIIRLPKSLEVIGDRAFEGCSGIKGSIAIPENVKEIGDRAFLVYPTYDETRNGFTGDLIIPDSVVKIGNSAFSGNYFGGKIKLSENTLVINDETFMYCKFTGDLVIPEKVRVIGAHAFDSQNNENPSFIDGGRLILSKDIEKIGMCAFMGAGLTGDIDLTGIEVGENAFMGNNINIISN